MPNRYKFAEKDTGKKINSRPDTNATKISIGRPILRVAIAQLATHKIYLARCLRCQSRSEHVKGQKPRMVDIGPVK